MDHHQEKRLETFLDREEIFDLVRRERFARDRRRFDMMRACFHEDAYVRTSWYDGRGAEAYIEATREWMGKRGGGTHWVFPALAEINGDRATVESPAMISSRTRLDGTEIDVHVFCRFFSRAVRNDGEWSLFSFEVLFERDIVQAVDPANELPIDQTMLAKLRPSYRHIAYLQQSRGVNLNPVLLGDDRPEQMEEFYRGEARWLRGEH